MTPTAPTTSPNTDPATPAQVARARPPSQAQTQARGQGADEDAMSLAGVFDRMALATQGQRVTLGRLLDAFGSRAHGPLLLIPATIVLFPTGAIPGVPTAAAVLTIVIAAQMAVSRGRPWLPPRVARVPLPQAALARGLRIGGRWARPIDKVTRPRLTWLARGPMVTLVAGVCILLAAAMPPLEVLPAASLAPAGVIFVLAFGLTVRDGIVILVGLALALAVAAFVAAIAITAYAWLGA